MANLGMRRMPSVGLLLVVLGFVASCSRPDWFVGLSGAYNEGKYEVLRRQRGDLDKAIENFEHIAKQDPAFRDSLTLLGRAYYKKGRYKDAYVMLQRAIALKQEDEFAWLTYGVTQLRLGENEKGLESVRGGLTLFAKATADDRSYRGYVGWDPGGKVKIAARRAVFVALKGSEQKDDLIRTIDALLAAVEEEEFYQIFEKRQQQQQYE